MSSMWRAGRFVLAIAAAVALAGCESGEPLAGPEVQPAGNFEAFEASVVSQAVAAGIDPTAAAPEMPMYLAGGHHGFVFVRGSVGDEAVEGVIGSAGGALNLGEHWLLVPRNAVRGDVLFRMTPIGDGTFHVDLTATRVNRDGTTSDENDVGRNGFRQPVYLGLHFGDPSQIDPASLEVAWLTNSGAVVMQQTFIYDQEWAVGVLRHFSGYVLVAN